jgi:hypothetical protein
MMKVNPFIYGVVVIVLFFGVIGAAKATGNWSVSGQMSGTGEKVMLTTANPDDIKGWMKLGDIATVFNVPLPELLAVFKLPADTPETTAVKELESETFSTDNLRTWLKERQAK